jgi:phospholipid transport system substrate-binding protein
MVRIGWLVPYAMLLALMSAVPSPLAAAEAQTSPEQASKFVQELGSRAVTLLSGHDADNATVLQTQLRGLIREGFDLALISRFVLGPSWERATPAQQQEYQDLFVLWTADSYARRLGADRGGSLTVVGAQPGLDTSDALVRTQINRADGTSIEADLRVRDRDGQMKIVDVTMEGVSMDVTQRDEFASIIQRKGLNGLIGDLRIHVNNPNVAENSASR